MNEKTLYKVLFGIVVWIGVLTIISMIHSFSIQKLISLIILCLILFSIKKEFDRGKFMDYHEVEWKMSKKHKWILFVFIMIIFLIGVFGTVEEYDFYYVYLVDFFYWMFFEVMLGFNKNEEKNQYFYFLIGTLGFDIVTGVYCFFFGSMMYGFVSALLCMVVCIVILVLLFIEYRNRQRKV